MSSNLLLSAVSVGKREQSDCFVEISSVEQPGISLKIIDKCESTNEEEIKKLVDSMVDFYGLESALIEISDYGAFYWVISARLEAAIKKAHNSDLAFVLDFNSKNNYYSKRDSDRVTRLYLRGNSPANFVFEKSFLPNAVILDLEDTVDPSEKDEARILVRNALRSHYFDGVERMVRINQGKMGIKDLEFVIPHNVHVILIPKAETAQGVQTVEEHIDKIRRKYKIEHRIFLMPIIESALGVERAFQIATASDQIVAISIGLEDYTLDIGAKRTNKGWESIYARSRVINAAHAARIQPLDSVYSESDNLLVLLKSVKESKARGFVGMGCIDPRQIQTVINGFTLNKNEMEQAKQIVHAANLAKKQGKAYVTIDNKLIEQPIIKRFAKKIEKAIEMGILTKEWEADMW